MDEVNEILESVARIKEVWETLDSPMFLLSLRNMALIYTNLYNIPLLPAVITTIEGACYENMDVTFRKVYGLENRANNLALDVEAKRPNMESIKHLYEVGRALIIAKTEIEENKEFQNLKATDGKTKELSDKLTQKFNAIMESATDFEHIAVLGMTL